MITKKIKENMGFVILFAVTLSAILLSIALGVSNIALKELSFSSSTRDANDAFYAADVGVECALANDKAASSSFVPGGSIYCLGITLTLNGAAPSWNFVIPGQFLNKGLGSLGQGCAIVSVFKDTTSNPPSVLTTITSKGYNVGDVSCTSTNPNRLERQLQVNY